MRIDELEKLLAESNERSNAVKVACDDYLKEEAALKGKLRMMDKELIAEKKAHREVIAELNSEIELWMTKYELDTTELRKEYINLSNFTDIERKLCTHITRMFTAKLQEQKKKLHGTQNILRTPRLTDLFHKRMRNKMSSW